MRSQMESVALNGVSDEGTFLPAIEKPKGLMMRLVYAMTRRQFGKVITPLKVFGARLPLAFGHFYGKVGGLDKKLQLPRETAMLIRERVAQTNVCLFCIDIGRYFTIKESMNQSKLVVFAQPSKTVKLASRYEGVAPLTDHITALCWDATRLK